MSKAIASNSCLGLLRPVLLSVAVLATALSAASADEARCEAPGVWLDPATGDVLAADNLLARMADKQVVLLGESHTAAEDHRWQASTLAALHGRRPDLVVGFEMFPRRLQPVLDRWSAGALRAEAFLEQAEWQTVWGYDAEHYLPLFHLVRQQRLPMVALNVERSLVSHVGREGWAAVPLDEREGLTDPAPASEAYRRSLAEVYRQKLGAMGDESSSEEPPTVEEILDHEGFGRFVEAQLTWDRAMAEALVGALEAQSGRLAVGIVGRGHAERGHGIPHQLADLGVTEVAVLLPLPPEAICGEPDPGLADAVFLVDPAMQQAAERPKPRLGVRIGPGDGGVEVSDVVAGSVAEAAGVMVEDVIVEAAGVPVPTAQDLIDIVQRQAPGTWLPLTVRRGEESHEIVARFPTSFAAPE